jgi:replicative DNA helicase
MEHPGNYEVEAPTLPHSRQAEEAVIGGLLINSAVMDEIDLTPEKFFILRLGWVWKVADELRKSGRAVDSLTICDALEAKGQLSEFGGPAYLTMLMNQCPSTLEVPTYARMVAEYAVRRDMLAKATRIAQLAYDQSKDVAVSLAEAEREIMAIEVGSQTRTSTNIKGIKAASEITDSASKGNIKTVKTGIQDLDEAVKLQAPDFMILAGRPGMGKTALLLTITDNILERGGRVLFFSLEMSTAQVHMRLLGMHSGVSVNKQREGKMTSDEWEKYYSAIERTQTRKLWVNDQSAITAREMRQATRAIGRKPDLVIVDYLQLMGADGRHENRTQEVGYISKSLLGFAKDFDVPVIAAAQLSRAVETRAEKTPQLSDLRESGSLEQDASIVAFISRAAQDSTEAVLNVAKNRNGQPGLYSKLNYNGVRSRFETPIRMQPK